MRITLFPILGIFAAVLFQSLEIKAADTTALVNEAFPPPVNAAERAKLEADFAALLPTPVEIAWQRQGVYGFMHFGLGTSGVWKRENFNPTNLDCRQWIRAYKAAGCKIVILTTKHHDGFCLWNTRYTSNSVAHTPWKNGKGDVIREFVDACHAEGIQAGLYISTGDGSQRKGKGFGDTYGNGSPAVESVIPTPVEGRPFPPGHKEFKVKVDDYNRFTMNQLYELVTEYGPIAHIWFDAPDPYPAGSQPYNNDMWHNMIKELSPDTILLGYSDGRVKRQPGGWRPREGGLTLIPAWFDRKDEDARIASSQFAMKNYFDCAGRGAVCILAVPPDSTGILADRFVTPLAKTGAAMRRTLGSQSCALWNDGKPNPLNRADGAPPAMLDNNEATVWTPDVNGPCEVDFKAKDKANLFLVEEDTSQGQRIRNFTLQKKVEGKWQPLLINEYTGEKIIGEKLILRTPMIEAGTELRLRITSSKAKPRLSEIGLFLYDPVLMPAIHRGKDGRVVIEGQADAAIHFTLDGGEPTAKSPTYSGPVDLPQGGLVRAVCVLGEAVSDCAQFEIGLSKAKWKILGFSNEENGAPVSAVLDDDLTTEWRCSKGKPTAEEDITIRELKEEWGVKEAKKKEPLVLSLTVDMGETNTLTGISYYPGDISGQWNQLNHFSLFIGDAPNAIKHSVWCGEFFNDDERRQHVFHFPKPVSCRYFRIEAPTCPRVGLSVADLDMIGK